MNNTALSQLGFILAAQARVLGMQAENSYRLACGESIAYGEAEFSVEAAHIEACAQEIAAAS